MTVDENLVGRDVKITNKQSTRYNQVGKIINQFRTSNGIEYNISFGGEERIMRRSSFVEHETPQPEVFPFIVLYSDSLGTTKYSTRQEILAIWHKGNLQVENDSCYIATSIEKLIEGNEEEFGDLVDSWEFVFILHPNGDFVRLEKSELRLEKVDRVVPVSKPTPTKLAPYAIVKLGRDDDNARAIERTIEDYSTDNQRNVLLMFASSLDHLLSNNSDELEELENETHHVAIVAPDGEYYLIKRGKLEMIVAK